MERLAGEERVFQGSRRRLGGPYYAGCKGSENGTRSDKERSLGMGGRCEWNGNLRSWISLLDLGSPLPDVPGLLQVITRQRQQLNYHGLAFQDGGLFPGVLSHQGITGFYLRTARGYYCLVRAHKGVSGAETSTALTRTTDMSRCLPGVLCTCAGP